MKKVQRRLVFLFVLILIGAMSVFSTSTTPVRALSWTANWIWQSVDGPANTWTAFRKTFTLSSVPATALADIAADTKYWMWINGNMAVFEGGLKRGPNPTDSYYDEVDIKSYLQTGTNTIAILVWHLGKDGFSHKNSGKGGLLFQADLGGTVIQTDTTWKMKVNSAYESTTANPQPNYRLAEYNVRFNAQNELAGWTQSGYNDASWSTPTTKGLPPATPWGNLWLRPIPQWKNSGLISYTNEASLGLPRTVSSTTVITAKLPYNAQVTPYLDIDAPAGLAIDMRTDDYCGGGNGSDYNVRGEYVTKSGVQTYESYGWMNGHEVQYTIPAGVTVWALKYRETGFNTNFTGSFSCNDSYYNTLWDKAKRTLYVTMRDNYFDCPDRERAQWWGDVTIEIGETFYALDRNSDLLSKKAISNLVEWQRANKTLFAPVPSGNWNSELPPQMLASVGKYGFWTYYWYTGDTATITTAYPHVRDYLTVWTLDVDGLVNHRAGDWDWEDWGSNIDQRVLDNCMYYLALQAAKDMANLTGNTGDVAGYDSKMTSIRNNFNRVLWNGTEYRSPGYGGDTDDRANAMAVVAGFADTGKWPAVRTVLLNHKNASPYMEKYVLEALYMMGCEQDALNRMKATDRYWTEVNDSTCSTLWEFWTKGGWGSYNHAWAGGPLTLLGQYGAGVAPETAGFGTFHVFPQVGNLTSINTVVPSIKGNITVGIASGSSEFDINLTSPSATTAIVGIPKNAFIQYGNKAINYITVGGTTVWSNGSYSGGASGISWNGEDGRNLKFNAVPGTYAFKAFPSSATCTPSPTPGPTATPTPAPTATPDPNAATSLSDNFDDNNLDTATRWNLLDKGLESTAVSGLTASEVSAQFKVAGTTSVSYWAGKTIQSKAYFNPTSANPLTVDVDRISLAGSGSAYRSSIWLWKSNTEYVHVSQNIGEGNWSYNKDGGTGTGTQIWNDANTSSKHVKLIHDGDSVHITIDGVERAAVPVAWNSGVKIMLTGQARASGDTVTAIFDNLNASISGAATPTPTPTATTGPTATPTPTPVPGSNLALNKTVNARVTLENTDWGKQKMVDGTQTSITGSKGYSSDPPQTTQSANEWVEIDLGANTAFTQVKIFPRTDVDTSGGETPNFPVDFTIQVKPNGGSYATVKTVTGQPNPGHTPQSYDIGSQNARYVKIDVTKLGLPAFDEGLSNYCRLQLAEVEIYNIAGATSTPTPVVTAPPTPTPAATATPVPVAWNFNTDGNAEGWILTHALSGSVSGGYYNLTISGSDPYMHSPDNLGVDASKYKKVKIRLKNSTTDTAAQLYWITTVDAAWSETKHSNFTINANDSGYTDYIIDLSANSYWTGTIRQLRLDPVANVSSGTTSIDSIMIMGM
jgi:alpha-L-rhamnosidase